MRATFCNGGVWGAGGLVAVSERRLHPYMMMCSFVAPRTIVSWTAVLDAANIVFVVIFALEAGLKVLAYGPLSYLRDPWHKFDAAVVILSVAGLGKFKLSACTDGSLLWCSALSTMPAAIVFAWFCRCRFR